MKMLKKSLSIVMVIVMLFSCFVITGSAASNKDRYSVLVLDVSGSMSGKKIEELKIGAKAFCDFVLKSNRSQNKVAIVTFASSIYLVSDFSSDLDVLNNAIDGLSASGGTDLAGGLKKAKSVLEAVEGDVIRNMLVMCDGAPNSATAAYNEIKTIPLFWNIYGLYYCPSGTSSSAANVMKNVGRNGYAEVTDATKLEYSFIDNGKTITTKSVNKVVVHIACPVDVSVTLNNVTLNRRNPQTTFGTLEFTGTGNDEEKILTLAYRNDYVIQIDGYDAGTMDYSIQYLCNDDELYNLKYPTTNVTSTTKITTGVNIDNSNMTLDVDADGDGNIDKNEQQYQKWLL